MSSEIRDLPPVPDWVGSLTTLQYDRLARKSTVHIPKPPKVECKTCNKAGEFLSWDKNGEDVVSYRCNCVDQYRLSMEMLIRGIDHEYQRLDWYDLDGAENSDWYELVFDYIDNAEAYVRHGMGMTLHGKPGTGKSLLMYLLAKNLVGQGIDVYFTQHNHLLDLYKSGWSDKEDKEYFRQRCYRSEVLFIDDLGTERDTTLRATEDTLLDQVLRTRSSNDLPTFVTTNIPVDFLEPGRSGGKYDFRIRSLISGKNETVEMSGDDYRPTRKKKRREEIKLGISRPVTLGW